MPATDAGRESPPFSVAIIGTGRMGDTFDEEVVHYPDVDLPDGVVHASMYTALPKSIAGAVGSLDAYDLVAGANRGRDRLEAFGDRHDVTGRYTDYREMLSEEQPDVVAVCTPSAEKRDAVVACAEAGVEAVIVQKAFATSLAEADEMLAACEASGTRVAVDHPMRFSPLFRRLKDLMGNGPIGEFSHVTSHTASLVHAGTHDFDVLRFLGGEVASVSARIPDLEPPQSGDPLTATYEDLPGQVTVTFESGAVGHVEGTSGAHFGMVIRGTEGYVTAPRSAGVVNLVRSRQRPAAAFGVPDGDARRDVRWEESIPAWPGAGDADQYSSTQRMLVELAEWLTDGTDFVSTGRDGAAALELAIAAYHSEIRSEPVELPVEERDLRVRNW